MTLLLLPCLSGLSLRGKKKKNKKRRWQRLNEFGAPVSAFFFLTVYSTYLLSVFFFFSLTTKKKGDIVEQNLEEFVLVEYCIIYDRPSLYDKSNLADKTFFSPLSVTNEPRFVVVSFLIANMHIT